MGAASSSAASASSSSSDGPLLPNAAPVPVAEAVLLPDVRVHIGRVSALFGFLFTWCPYWVLRLVMDAGGKGIGPLPDVQPAKETALTISGDDGAPRAARIYEPPHLAGRAAPLLFYIHGGGWVLGSVASHAATCRALAAALGWRVVAVTYRLAPESQYPAAALDVLAAYKYVAANGAQFGLEEAPRIVVCGDSAGGQLALELGLRVRDTAGLMQPVLLAPIYPVINMRGGETASWVKFGSEYLLEAQSMRSFFNAYLGETPELRARHASNAYLNPDLRVDFSGVPPIVLLTAEFDLLGDEGRAFVATARARGASVQHMDVKGNLHGCLSPIPGVPSNLAALREYAALVKAGVEGRAKD
jgi:acetyl esterase